MSFLSLDSQVHPVEAGASQLRRAPAGLQRDPAGRLPAHGGRVRELRNSEVL